MSTSQNNNYIDVYEQVIDEDPGDQSFEVPENDGQMELFDEYDELEEEAYEDLAKQTKKGKMIQSGGDIRTQEKRPFSQKLINSL